MPSKQLSPSSQLSVEAQLMEPGDVPFRDAGRALVKAGFLFINQVGRPYQKFDLTLAQMDVLGALARCRGREPELFGNRGADLDHQGRNHRDTGPARSAGAGQADPFARRPAERADSAERQGG